MSFTPEEILAEAKRQLQLEEEKEAQEKRVRQQKEMDDILAKEKTIENERVRLLAEEEQIRITARRLMLEAEAKSLADAKERAVQKEMERLRNRSPFEVLEDKLKLLEEAFKAPPKPSVEPETVKRLEDKIQSLESELQEQKDHNRFIQKAVQESLVDFRTHLAELQKKNTSTESLQKQVNGLEQLMILSHQLYKQTEYGNYTNNGHIHQRMEKHVEKYKARLGFKEQRKFIFESPVKNWSPITFSLPNWRGGHTLTITCNLTNYCIEAKDVYHDSHNQSNNKDTLLASIPFSRLGLKYEKDTQYTFHILLKKDKFQISTSEMEGDTFGYGSFYETPNNVPLDQIISSDRNYDLEEVFE